MTGYRVDDEPCPGDHNRRSQIRHYVRQLTEVPRRVAESRWFLQPPTENKIDEKIVVARLQRYAVIARIVRDFIDRLAREAGKSAGTHVTHEDASHGIA